jgi:hypothetical protein
LDAAAAGRFQPGRRFRTAEADPFTQGWVSAPYDPVWAERHPGRAALMAAAGPAGNFLMQIFPLLTDPLFMLLLRVLHPELTDS